MLPAGARRLAPALRSLCGSCRALEGQVGAMADGASAIDAGGFFNGLAGGGGAYKFYLDGAWRESSSGKVVAIGDPTSQGVAFHVQACTPSEVDATFEAAKAAQKFWARTPLWRRAAALHAAAQLMRDHPGPIADALVREVAKARKDSMAEVVRSADLIDYTAEEGVRYLGEGKLLTSDSFPGNERNKLCLESRVPLGVVLCIPPFNYPVNLAVSKIAPALMAGNTVVLKPPTQGSVAAIHMLQCFHKAGLPAGVVNLVTGRGSEIGDYLTTHKSASCISFTGGNTGIAICKKASMVPVQMELGGKDACIVCSDADLALAASSIVKGAFSYSGQRCTAVKVVLVEAAVADDLVDRVLERVARLTVGSPEDDAAITPVISKSSADFIESLVEDARARGGRLRMDYRREGNLIWPLVVDGVTAEMRLAWEEPFGPVLPVMRVDSVDQAVDHCNASDLALQGCVFTRDVDKAVRISDAMETGSVQINAAPARGPDHFPFQGFRSSGIGSQGVRNSLQMMSKVKSTVINLATPSYTMG